MRHEDIPHRDGHMPEPPTREDMLARVDEASLTELLNMCGHILHNRHDNGMMRGQGRALMLLSHCGELPQQELQQLLDIRPASMSELADKLERRGLITRVRGEDRRGNTIGITEAGREAVRDTAAPEDADLFSALSAEQRDTLAGLLRVLLNGWISNEPVPPRRRPGHPAGHGEPGHRPPFDPEMMPPHEPPFGPGMMPPHKPPFEHDEMPRRGHNYNNDDMPPRRDRRTGRFDSEENDPDDGMYPEHF